MTINPTTYPTDWTDIMTLEQAKHHVRTGRCVVALLGMRLDETTVETKDVLFRDSGPSTNDPEEAWMQSQNDFNPRKVRSAVAGDVIFTPDRKLHLIQGMGTREISLADYRQYVAAGANRWAALDN